MEGVEVIIMTSWFMAKIKEECDARLKRRTDTMTRDGLLFHGDKCTFAKAEVVDFRHLVSSNIIKPYPEIYQILEEFSSPENVDELNTVLGMFNYLDNFLPDLTATMKPMSNLLMSNMPWACGPA